MLSDPGAYGWPEVYVAIREGRIVGFGCCERQRIPIFLERGIDGEFSSIYITKSDQGVGLGRRLMEAMAKNLLSRNRSAAGLWVLRENEKARRFYKCLGGTAVAEKADVRPGATLVEVGYAWSDLQSLALGGRPM
jgi:ribosomal protein S18 acetylase RimI-like enzyme